MADLIGTWSGPYGWYGGTITLTLLDGAGTGRSIFSNRSVYDTCQVTMSGSFYVVTIESPRTGSYTLTLTKSGNTLTGPMSHNHAPGIVTSVCLHKI